MFILGLMLGFTLGALVISRQYQEEHEILLNNLTELRTKIFDLENNIEFLVSQLSNQKRKLIRPGNSVT